MSQRTNFKYPAALATTRRLSRGNRHTTAGFVALTALALLISPVLALGMVGLMLWHAWQPD